MKDFTSTFRTINDLKSKDQKLFESFMIESGLPEEAARKLFESGFELDDDIKPETDEFQSAFSQFLDVLKNASKDAINEVIIGFLTNVSAKSKYFDLFKIIMFMLFLKDNVNYKRVSKRVGIDAKLWKLVDTNQPLYESFEYSLDNSDELQKILITKIPGFNIDRTLTGDLGFYVGLRHILTSINKPFGISLDLMSAHDAMVDYLTSEIEMLSNKQSIHSVDNTAIETILEQLISGKLSPHYKDVRILKSSVSDIQRLVLELIQFVAYYFKQNTNYASFISVDQLNNWSAAYDLIISKLQSSVVGHQSRLYDLVQKFQYYPTSEGFDFPKPNYRLSYQSVQDALLLIKTATPDFNLNLRNALNNFITHSLSFSLRINNVKQNHASARLDHDIPS